MADDEHAETVEQLSQRLDQQESKLDKILAMLGGSKAPDPGEQTRPESVEEQVRAELAKAEAERQKAADADAEKSERQTIRETLAKLTEKPPVQPQPRRQKLMWGGR